MFRSATILFALAAGTIAWSGPAPKAVSSPEPDTSASQALSAEAIYLRAAHAMREEPQPPYVVFREDVTARNMRLQCNADGTSLTLKHGDSAGIYRVSFRTRDERAATEDMASQQHCRGALLYPTGADIAALGASTAAPNPFPEPSVSSDGPPLIGAVRIESARYYRVTYVDRETFEGHDVYRLALKAYRDPNAHPLTGLLVDADSFLVRQVQGEAGGNYVVASGHVAGVVTFDRSGSYWLVREEHFELAGQALFVHARSTVIVRGSQYAFPQDVPDSLFASPSPLPSRKSKV